MISTITDFVSSVLALKQRWDPAGLLSELWFRGINNQSLRLLPGAYWRSECDETSMVASFRAMSPSLLQREPTDAWEWYYLMQHYGLPTRLLDWTESPLAALYFALERESTGNTPCVWVLDPLALNRLSGIDYIPMPRDRGATRRWLTEFCGRDHKARAFTKAKHSHFRDNSRPLAIFPKRHNPRIVAQRGAFTVHGTEEVAIEDLAVTSADGEPRVEKLIIDPSAVRRIWDELWALGINKTAIYPEPQSLAEDLRRLYGAD